ncbi:hypothetical protein [Natronobiforma cellulositropha]|uniref:hypothetical protein n=1 Tax=Natronobiforma cellulositropha TaxID=1679076 RepID=UPI0021D5DB84|nr:hypothetical protein [Natronobiforma cellulositropha]
MMRLNRGLPACVMVVVVCSVTLFWLPVVLVFDLTHMIAGFLAGRLGGTAFRGTLAGVIGGLFVLVLWLVVYAVFGWVSLTALVWLLSIPVYTSVFGAIGGWTGRTV